MNTAFPHASAFSPDGRWIAYMDSRTLRKISVDGGAPVRLTDAHESGSGTKWVGDHIYFCRNFTSGVLRIPANGGEARVVVPTDPAKGYRAVLWPEVLPGEEWLLATVWSAGAWDDAKIVAFSLRDGTSKVLIEGGTHPTYSPTGHLLYGRGSSLMAVPFDAKTLAISASPIAVVQGVAMDPETGEMQYRLADRGDLLYAAGSVHEEKRQLLWVDRNGVETPVAPTQRPYSMPSVSPDGRSIAVTMEGATYDVWLLDVERDLLTRLSFGGDDSEGLFTPDGRHVVWQSTRSGTSNLYRTTIDGSGGEERLLPSTRSHTTGIPAPDGRHVLFSEEVSPGSMDLMLLDLQTRQAKPFLTTQFDERPSGFSPDGKWALYWSNESGHVELYARSFPGGGAKSQVSNGGGVSAEWSRDGRTIFYRDGSRFYEVPVEQTPALRIGKPRLMFERPYVRDVQVGNDGRLLLVKDDAPWATPQLTIVLNWTEELKRRVPSR